MAKKAVEDGILDYVGLAHQMLADPYWPKKVKAHHEEDIAPLSDLPVYCWQMWLCAN